MMEDDLMDCSPLKLKPLILHSNIHRLNVSF